MNSFRSPSDSHESIENYRRQGFVFVRGLLDSADLVELRQAADKLFHDPAICHPRNLRAQLRTNADGAQVVDRLDPVSDLAGCFSRALWHPKLMTLISQLAGEPMRPFKDKLIWKNPGAHGYELHQDYTFWLQLGPPPGEMLTVAIAIDPATATNGAIRLYPGLHDRHRLPDSVPCDIFSAGSGVLPQSVVAGCESVIAEMDAGDALVFSSLTPHESDLNRSHGARRQLMGSYCPSRYGDLCDRYYTLFQGYLLDSESGKDRTAACEDSNDGSDLPPPANERGTAVAVTRGSIPAVGKYFL